MFRKLWPSQLELQSQDDPWRALRIHTYSGLLYQELVRNEAPEVADGRPPIPRDTSDQQRITEQQEHRIIATDIILQARSNRDGSAIWIAVANRLERTDRLETVLAAFMERADHAIARIDEAMERTSFDRPNAPDRAGSPMSRREGRAACRRTRSPRRGSPRWGSWWTGRGTGRRPRTVSWTVAHLERGDVARPAAEHSTPIR